MKSQKSRGSVAFHSAEGVIHCKSVLSIPVCSADGLTMDYKDIHVCILQLAWARLIVRPSARPLVRPRIRRPSFRPSARICDHVDSNMIIAPWIYYHAAQHDMDSWICYHLASNMIIDLGIYQQVASIFCSIQLAREVGGMGIMGDLGKQSPPRDKRKHSRSF